MLWKILLILVNLAAHFLFTEDSLNRKTGIGWLHSKPLGESGTVESHSEWIEHSVLLEGMHRSFIVLHTTSSIFIDFDFVFFAFQFAATSLILAHIRSSEISLQTVGSAAYLPKPHANLFLKNFFVLRPESSNFRAMALNESWPSLSGSTKK